MTKWLFQEHMGPVLIIVLILILRLFSVFGFSTRVPELSLTWFIKTAQLVYYNVVIRCLN